MKVLIVNPPSNEISYTAEPPIGPLYIASYLSSKGLHTSMIDLGVGDNQWRRRLKKELSTEPTIVGISSNFTNYNYTMEIAEICKEQNVGKVVVGGPLPTAAPQLYLGKNVDAAIIGEGEVSFFDFVSNGPKAKGLAFQKGGKTLFTGARPPIKNLDTLPFPAYNLVNVKKYGSAALNKQSVLGLVTSRGCPFNCIFCDHRVFGGRWRTRTLENVIDELRWQVDVLGAKGIHVYDENICLDVERLNRLLSLIKNENFGVSWKMVNFKADVVNNEMAKKLSDIGCKRVCISPEVGSLDTLKKINKNFDFKKLSEGVQILREHGIVVQASFILGFPFETVDDMWNTINYASKLDPDICDFNKLMVFPKTPLQEHFFPEENFNHLFSKYSLINNSSLDDAQYNELFKRAYKEFYLKRPARFLRLFVRISWREIMCLVKYSFDIGAI